MRRAAYLLIMVFLVSATTLSGCSLMGSSSTPEATPVTQAPASDSTPGADLPTPNTSDATPSALPGEPSAASATPATSPSPTPEPASAASGWRTYEDAEQHYRLRYPDGATIATDQSGQTTFTLTDNQTTYTVQMRTVEAPARPASYLETIHQSFAVFDISEIQELTINGVQAALLTFSCCRDAPQDAVQEPCGAQRSQRAAFRVGKQLYVLTFKVAGPDQCDATAVPWFEQMLHSFEPY